MFSFLSKIHLACQKYIDVMILPIQLGVGTIVQGTFVQGEFCPRRLLSKEDYCPRKNIVQRDICPRRQLSKEAIIQGYFLSN